MLTHRGWLFFVTVLVLTALCLGRQATTVTLIAFTLLAWFLGQWLMFAIRTRQAGKVLSIEREIVDERGSVSTLWARLPANVRLALHCDRRASYPFVSMIERVPVLAERLSGEASAEGSVTADQPLELTYRIECPAPGRLRFEGVKLRFVDLQGFFVRQTFLRKVQVYRVLPPLADYRGHIPSVKRHNLIPLMGHHRQRRPGSGSELLDLREYLPGDPPKMIAWKASARRNRLMTKELESEVPIRCTLFVDASNSVRVGQVGRNALARLVEIAAAVAQANASARDFTGLCLFDDNGTREQVRPSRGATHLVKLSNILAEAADLYPQTDKIPLTQLLPLAYGVLQDMYPDWLDDEINSVPIFARRQYRWRKQLAAVLSIYYQLGPGGLARLMDDDDHCRLFTQRFLSEHQVPVPATLADDANLFAEPAKYDVLAGALLHAVARGRDNELFVVLADLSGTAPHLEKFLRAVRVALGKHHRVVVVTPDADMAAPARDLARLGVPVLSAGNEQAVGVILKRMQQLRSLERGVR